MPILGALGLGLMIIVLKTLVSDIFAELETTIILGLHAVQVPLSIAAQMAAVASQASLAP